MTGHPHLRGVPPHRGHRRQAVRLFRPPRLRLLCASLRSPLAAPSQPCPPAAPRALLSPSERPSRCPPPQDDYSNGDILPETYPVVRAVLGEASGARFPVPFRQTERWVSLYRGDQRNPPRRRLSAMRPPAAYRPACAGLCEIPIVTGFLARAKTTGAIATLGRGGSDLTATVLGRALCVKEVQVWKDVDGVLTADPRVVPNAVPVPFLTYEEATELVRKGGTHQHAPPRPSCCALLRPLYWPLRGTLKGRRMLSPGPRSPLLPFFTLSLAVCSLPSIHRRRTSARRCSTRRRCARRSSRAASSTSA